MMVLLYRKLQQQDLSLYQLIFCRDYFYRRILDFLYTFFLYLGK